MARAIRWIGVVLFLAIAVAGAAGGWVYSEYVRPGPSTVETVVIVERGAGISGIGAVLAREGVISNPLVFRIALRVFARDKTLKAGEYAFAAGASQRDVVDLLDSGKTVVRRLTIAEGLTTAEILDLVSIAEGLTGPVPDGVGEGSLLPETYHFSYGDSRIDLVRRMQDGMREMVAAAWAIRAPDLPLSGPEEAVILASIIEKETGRADERGRIAGVFINRLRRGMRLQSDPTVVYGVADGKGALGRALTRSDLQSRTPYNTYVIDGLPPTAICNPGSASLEAAVQPAATGDLYFVADGDGGHVFARTLREHNANVARWRKLQREQNQQ